MSQLTIQKKGQWQHALKFKPGPTHASNQTDLQLQGRFGVATVKGQAGAVSIKKYFVKFGDPEFLTDEMERLIMQNKEFRNFGLRCNWNGNEYFQNYKDICGRHLTKIYNKVITQGTEYFDPGHPQAFTPDGFDRFLMAIFSEYVDHKAPAVVVSQKIKSFTYNTLREFDCPVRPKKVTDRLDDLWALVDDLPAPGNWQPPDDDDKAQAVYAGLSREAIAFIEEEKNIDIFDAINGGANHYTYAAIFAVLEEFWARKYREISEKNQAKALSKKRDRDDDTDEDDTKQQRINEDEDAYEDDRYEDDRYKDDSFSDVDNEDENDDNEDNSDDDNSDDDDNYNGGSSQLTFFQKPCTLAACAHSKAHDYGDCVFCPSGKNFCIQEARKLYDSKGAPGWWLRTYERRGLHKRNQEPQFHFVPVYYSGTPAAPGTIAPVFATGASAPAAQPAQATFQQVRDAAGNVYFVQM